MRRYMVLLVVFVAARLCGQELPSETRLDIDGADSGVQLKEGVVIGGGKILQSYRKIGYGYSAYLPVPPNTWTKVGIRFTPMVDGKVDVILMGKFLPVENGNAVIPTYWDAMACEGATLVNPDFEEVADGLPVGWTKHSRDSVKLDASSIADRNFVRSGKRSALAWHDASFSQTLEVKANVPVSIEGWAYVDNPALPHVTTIDLSCAANMGLVDETANDQKGGWTDQGKGNDLSSLSRGRGVFAGVPFVVAGGDKAAIVLRGQARSFFPESVTLPIPGSVGQPKWLYLLHATAFTKEGKAGRIVAVHADGAVEEIPVMVGRDVGDWWNAGSRENGYVGFISENGSSFIGLFVSKFPLKAEGGDLTALRFESGDGAVWGVAGVSVSDDDIPFPKKQIYSSSASTEWVPIKVDERVEVGTALDFSGMFDAPAGGRGFLATGKDGRYVFEKGAVPARFAGTCMGTFNTKFLGGMTHEELAALAGELARQGYNCLRFQYVDRLFFKDREDLSSIDEQYVDSFDFFLAELKKSGVYFTIDLVWSRGPEKLLAKHFPSSVGKDWRGYYFTGFYLVPELREELKRFSKTVLTHVNPYTGLSWKDDPALLYLDMINEDPLSLLYPRQPAEVAALYEKAFNAFVKKRYDTTERLSAAWGDLRPEESVEKDTIVLPKSFETGRRGADVCAFLLEIQSAGYQEIRSYLRNELGVKQPLADCNMVNDRYTALLRRGFDLVDQHAYWDHPGFPKGDWGLPYSYHNSSVMRRLRMPMSNISNDSYGAYLATTRLFGKPYFVTEYNFVSPNVHRSEAGLYLGSLAALQGWDGIWSMGYAYDRAQVSPNAPLQAFMSASDPVMQATERQMKLLYLRGDVREAAGAVSIFARPSEILERWDLGGEAAILSFATKVGLDIGEAPAPGGGAVLPLRRGVACPEANIPLSAADDDREWFSLFKTRSLPEGNQSDLAKGVVESDRGETCFNFTEGIIYVDTPRTKGWVVKGKGSYELPGLQADIDAGACSLTVSSLDGKPIAESGRLLVIFPTDALNSNMKFESEDRTLLLALGTTPVLLRAGAADITLANRNNLKAYALAMSGKRVAEVPVTIADGKLSFRITHAIKDDAAVLYWELAAEDAR